MNIIDQKTEIINWIDKLRDEDILKDILAIKERESIQLKNEILNAVSVDEARKITKDFIKNLPWKK